MTESVLDTRQDTADYDDPPPMRRGMPVTIVEDDTKPELATIASFNTYTLLGTEQPFRLLAQDRRRKKATIVIAASPSSAPNVQQVATGLAVTNNGRFGTTIDLAPFGEDVTGVVVDVHVSNVTGTTPTVQLQLQGSADGVNWSGAGLGSTAAITAGGDFRISGTVPLERFLRLNAFNIGGTTPSFTVDAIATVNTNLAASEIASSVRLSSQKQVSNQQGSLIYAPTTITYEAESEVWVQPQGGLGGAVTLTVIEERRTPRD